MGSKTSECVDALASDDEFDLPPLNLCEKVTVSSPQLVPPSNDKEAPEVVENTESTSSKSCGTKSLLSSTKLPLKYRVELQQKISVTERPRLGQGMMKSGDVIELDLTEKTKLKSENKFFARILQHARAGSFAGNRQQAEANAAKPSEAPEEHGLNELTKMLKFQKSGSRLDVLKNYLYKGITVQRDEGLARRQQMWKEEIRAHRREMGFNEADDDAGNDADEEGEADDVSSCEEADADEENKAGEGDNTSSCEEADDEDEPEENDIEIRDDPLPKNKFIENEAEEVESDEDDAEEGNDDIDEDENELKPKKKEKTTSKMNLQLSESPEVSEINSSPIDERKNSEVEKKLSFGSDYSEKKIADGIDSLPQSNPNSIATDSNMDDDFCTGPSRLANIFNADSYPLPFESQPNSLYGLPLITYDSAPNKSYTFDSLKLDANGDTLDFIEQPNSQTKSASPPKKSALQEMRDQMLQDLEAKGISPSQDLLGICSGKFETQNSKKEKKVEKNESFDKSPENFDDEEKKFDENEEKEMEKISDEENEEKNSEEEKAEKISDEEKETEKNSDEENSGIDSEFENEEADAEADVDPEMNSSDDERKLVPIFVEKKKIKGKVSKFRNDFGKIRKKFLEREAELSGSDIGSDEGDELNSDEDAYEEEAGDLDDLPSDEELRNQINQVHMKKMLDDDKRRLLLYQNAYLEDGDMHSDTNLHLRFRRKLNALEDAELPDWAAPSDDEAEAEAENDDEKIFNNSHDEFLQQSQMSAKRRLMLHQQERQKLEEQASQNSIDGSQNLIGQLNNSQGPSEPVKQAPLFANPAPATVLSPPKLFRSNSNADRRGSFLGRQADQLKRLNKLAESGGRSGKRGSAAVFTRVEQPGGVSSQPGTASLSDDEEISASAYQPPSIKRAKTFDESKSVNNKLKKVPSVAKSIFEKLHADPVTV